ncbi:hypothetical protein MLD38_027309 [Melastoma candidum]|uniref:Uncharacterized protein n=1 Tax=Melastoma candidum TaxID=119954 RepID=A0ACB9P162_9MYRT|nr:hypothetical protein MLD38_027309 [Melastoma candidum]
MGSGKEEKKECLHRVAIPPPKPFLESLRATVKETFFADDPFHQFKGQPPRKRFLLGFQYLVPFVEWAPRYTFDSFKGDLLSGITIATLAIPQGISYAKLANLPPIIGLYSSFVPPLIYAMLGSSRDLAVGTVAVPSLLMASMLGKDVSPTQDTKEYVNLVLTATFFAGVFQAALGFLRLGFIVDFLSHATIVGFMGGAATVVLLQQLKGLLGLAHFTSNTDLISVVISIASQAHSWKWQCVLLGCCFLFFLLLTKYLMKRKKVFFWINAMAPLTCVILATLIVSLTHAENHGVQVIGRLSKGLNPLSVDVLAFGSPYLATAIKTGIITGAIALAEGVAVGRSFAISKNYHIDGNKEMIAFGLMNIVGSCTSCYLTSGPFSRSAVNSNAGCKSAVSNIVMAVGIMITLLLLTPLFYHTPLVVLSSIVITAMLGSIDYQAAIHLWQIDKFDFLICLASYNGVVFSSVETGLIIAVTLSLLRLLISIARPRTFELGNIPNSMIYRSIDQYPNAERIPAILILQIDSPIYFANSNYLRERISRWIHQEEDRIKATGESSLQYVVLDLSAVGSIDTSGISMLEEINGNIEGKGLKLVLANPRSEVIKKLDKSKFIESLGQEWIYLTVGEAVSACNFVLPGSWPNVNSVECDAGPDNNV